MIPLGVLASAYVAPAGGASGVYDSFNRANSTTGLGTADTGQSWIPVAGVLGITNNEAYLVSGNAMSVINFGNVIMQVSATVSVFADYWPDIYACTDVNGAGGFIANKDNAGMRLASYGGSYPIANGDTVTLRVASASETTVNVSLLINGATKITWAGRPRPSASNTYAGYDI